jgi:hypothetical protein
VLGFTSCDQIQWCQIEIVLIIKDMVALFRQKPCSGRRLANLLFEHFFDLPDFFFNFAAVVFGFAFNL